MPTFSVRMLGVCPRCGNKRVVQDSVLVGRTPSGKPLVRPMAFSGKCHACQSENETKWQLQDGRIISTQELDRMKD